MKKIALLLIAFATISITSCKKDYTCTCVTYSNAPTAKEVSTIHNTKQKALTNCNANGSITSGSIKNCKID